MGYELVDQQTIVNIINALTKLDRLNEEERKTKASQIVKYTSILGDD